MAHCSLISGQCLPATCVMTVTRCPPLLSLRKEAADYVVDLGTFSKVFSPGIRVGWGVFPRNLIEPLLDIRSNIDFGAPHINQSIVHGALASGELERHLPTILNGYRVKRRRDGRCAQRTHGRYPWRALAQTRLAACMSGQVTRIRFIDALGAR